MSYIVIVFQKSTQNLVFFFISKQQKVAQRPEALTTDPGFHVLQLHSPIQKNTRLKAACF